MKNGKYWYDGPMQAVFDFIGICYIVVLVLTIINYIGCTRVQRDTLKSAVVSVSDCAFHTSMACASQALAGCPSPSDGEGYGEFGNCLVDKSASCSGRGLGLCLLKGVVNVAGSLNVAGGGVGCTGNEGISEVKSCVSDVTLETEVDAVNAVAACYRHVCMEGPNATPKVITPEESSAEEGSF